MATQQPRPPWFRFSSLASRAPAPPPTRPPAPAPTRPPAPARPSIPIRPTQTQEPIPPPQQSVPPPPPPRPAPAAVPTRAPVARATAPPPPPPALPRSPVGAPAPRPSPPRAPERSPVARPVPATAPPPAPAAAPPRSPVQQPAQPSPPAAPTPATKSPPTSPVQKEILTTAVRNSPAPKPVAAAATTEAVNGKATTPISSPKIIKPFEAYNNTIVYNGKREPSKSKKLCDSEELEVRVITLAGENKGAVMELNPSNKKIYLRKNGDQSSSENGEEGKSINKDKANGSMTMQYPMTAYLNSNAQGINNSIVCNGAFRHKDPGIHLSFRKANGGRSKD